MIFDLFSKIEWKKLLASLILGFILAYLFAVFLTFFDVGGPKVYLIIYWGTIISEYLLYSLRPFKEIFGIFLMTLGLVFISFPIIQEINAINYTSQIFSSLRAQNATVERIDAFFSFSIPSIFGFGVVVENLAALMIGIAFFVLGYSLQKQHSKMKKTK